MPKRGKGWKKGRGSRPKIGMLKIEKGVEGGERRSPARIECRRWGKYASRAAARTEPLTHMSHPEFISLPAIPASP